MSMYNQAMTWQKLSSKTVYMSRYIKVTEDELLTDYGDQVTFGVVHKEPGVSVIPFDGEYFYLVRQYRYPVDYSGWEFPAGHLEHDSLEEAAKEELEEEAGLVASKLEKIGSYYEAPGHLTQEIHVYLATGLTPGKQSLEPAEKGMVVKKFSLSEIEQMIKSGEIKDGLTIAAFTYFKLSHNKDIIKK